MAVEFSRRAFTGLLASTAISSPLVQRAAAQEMPQIKWATFTPGFVPAYMQGVITHGFDRANGVALSTPTPYSSLTSYYGDFVAGAFDVSFGSWDTFATRALAGVPVRYLCGINPGDLLNIVTISPDLKHLTELRGKTLAAPTSSGTFRLVKGLIKAFLGFDLEKETTIQTVDHPLAGVTYVLADRADAALTWEPSVSIGMAKNPKLRVLLNIGQAYREHENNEMPYLGLAIRQETLDRYPGIAAKLARAFASGVESINADPISSYKAAEQETGLPAEVLVSATQSGRLLYRFASMTDPVHRNAILRSSEILAAERNLPRSITDSFFAV